MVFTKFPPKGPDLAGALTLSQPAHAASAVLRAIPDEAALERVINELSARLFLVGEEGVSMSLAGAQDKLSIVYHSGVLATPANGHASTHILKPDNPRLLGSVQNEALCMVLAQALGLPTASVTTGRGAIVSARQTV